jgi:hypothetical protein
VFLVFLEYRWILEFPAHQKYPEILEYLDVLYPEFLVILEFLEFLGYYLKDLEILVIPVFLEYPDYLEILGFQKILEYLDVLYPEFLVYLVPPEYLDYY